MTHKLICDMKPTDRRAETERQISAAVEHAHIDSVVLVTWTPSRFDRFREEEFVVHGISDPLDLNARECILLSRVDDPDVKWLTLGLHMLGAVKPYHLGKDAD